MPSSSIRDAIRSNSSSRTYNPVRPIPFENDYALECKVFGLLVEYYRVNKKTHGFIKNILEKLRDDNISISQSKMSELLKTWNQTKTFFGNLRSNLLEAFQVKRLQQED